LRFDHRRMSTGSSRVAPGTRSGGAMWTHGHQYTRQQIRSRLGGDLIAYLPSSQGRIVCGCFRLDTNPHAPEVILPGTGPAIEGKAATLCRQPGQLPVFIKRDTNTWEYMGDYRVRDRSTSSQVIAEHARRAGRSDVTSVIFMERVR